MLRTDFLKRRPLISRAAYHGIVLALWLYTFTWVVAFMALVRYAERMHWLILGAFALVLLLGTPSLRDLVKSYDGYKESWDEYNRAGKSEVP